MVTTSQPNFSYVVGVLLGNGDGTFQNPAFLTGQFTMPNVILSDFNGDGKLDIVVTSCCGDTQPSYFVGNGDGTFQSAVALNGGPSAYAVVAADFNADGKPDLAFADQGSNSGYVTVLLNTSQVSAFLTKSATDGQIEPFAAESICGRLRLESGGGNGGRDGAAGDHARWHHRDDHRFSRCDAPRIALSMFLRHK